MAMTTCKECGKELSDKAEKCPHCGAPRKKASGSSKAIFLGIVILIVVGWLVGSIGTSPQSSKQTVSNPAEAREARLSGEACVYATDAVRARLKAPKTADFPGCVLGLHNYEIRADAKRETWWVQGKVDAQNSYGATIRRAWIVKLKLRQDKAGRSNWQTLSVNLDE